MLAILLVEIFSTKASSEDYNKNKTGISLNLSKKKTSKPLFG